MSLNFPDYNLENLHQKDSRGFPRLILIFEKTQLLMREETFSSIGEETREYKSQRYADGTTMIFMIIDIFKHNIDIVNYKMKR